MHRILTIVPDIDVSLVLSDNELDLACARPTSPSAGHAAPAGTGAAPSADGAQPRLCLARLHTRKYGKPKSVDELDQHRLIIFGEEAARARED